MIVEDDRTPEEKVTHPILIVGTDSFLSGWGEAKGGASYAAWACTWDQRNDCLCWVEKRGDMKRVREVYDGPLNPYRPGRGCAHLHIYVWAKPGVVRA